MEWRREKDRASLDPRFHPYRNWVSLNRPSEFGSCPAIVLALAVSDTFECRANMSEIEGRLSGVPSRPCLRIRRAYDIVRRGAKFSDETCSLVIVRRNVDEWTLPYRESSFFHKPGRLFGCASLGQFRSQDIAKGSLEDRRVVDSDNTQRVSGRCGLMDGGVQESNGRVEFTVFPRDYTWPWHHCRYRVRLRLLHSFGRYRIHALQYKLCLSIDCSVYSPLRPFTHRYRQRLPLSHHTTSTRTTSYRPTPGSMVLASSVGAGLSMHGEDTCYSRMLTSSRRPVRIPRPTNTEYMPTGERFAAQRTDGL